MKDRGNSEEEKKRGLKMTVVCCFWMESAGFIVKDGEEGGFVLVDGDERKKGLFQR